MSQDPPASPLSPRLDEPLMPPQPQFGAQGGDLHPQRGSLYSQTGVSNRESSGWNSRTSLNEDRTLLGAQQPAAHTSPQVAPSPLPGKSEADAGLPAAAVAEQKRRKRWLIPVIVAAVLLLAVAIALGVYFGVVRPNNDNDNSGGSDNGNRPTSTDTSSSSQPTPTSRVLFGTDGATVTADDGSTFTYSNQFGGYYYYDPENPTAGGGRCNEWTPPINESWPYGQMKMHGVNLGGWLVLEPFISPAPFEKYQGGAFPVVDEYTLSQAMAADTGPGGGLQQLEEHYKTFITEKDFADIAGAGLNWIRLPVPFWAISKLPNEPYLEGVAWTYFLKAIEWARKYGLRINLDLHTLPGSQNGWNHSGKLGTMNWLQGVMGVANAERGLDVIRFYTQFISQPEINQVVQMFGVINEPRNLVGIQNVKRYYYQLYTMIRGITGLGRGPFISFHTAFSDNAYDNWLPRADRLMLDKHPYIVFTRTPTRDPPSSFAAEPCRAWGNWANSTSRNFGLNSAGEFSAAINDCGLWLNSVGGEIRYENQFGAGSCEEWNRWERWTDERKAGLRDFVSASMDANQDYFFWTWRIGESLQTGTVLTPQWSYRLGLENGWIYRDPRQNIGACERLGYSQNNPFTGPYQPWQTSGEGATLTPTTTEDYSWPPPTLVDQPNARILPTYTATGPLPTLAMPTGVSGNGWFNAQDTRGAYVPVAGCEYPDQWDANGVAIPPACTGA